MTSFFRFVNKRVIYQWGIISLAHASVHVTDFPVVNVHVVELSSASNLAAYIVCDIVRKRKYKLPSSNPKCYNFVINVKLTSGVIVYPPANILALSCCFSPHLMNVPVDSSKQ